MRNKTHHLLHFYMHFFYISLKTHKKMRRLPTANLQVALSLYHFTSHGSTPAPSFCALVAESIAVHRCSIAIWILRLRAE